jgi:hypothetical protein
MIDLERLKSIIYAYGWDAMRIAASVCGSCKHLESVDIELFAKCSLHGRTLLKLRCRDYEPKEAEKK